MNTTRHGSWPGDRRSAADDGEFTYNDVAVFYRINNSSPCAREGSFAPGIPYKVVGGVRFYERIRDIVAYLRVLDNPGDAVSMRRILNTPRGIGDRAEACVAVYAENTGGGFNDALQAAAEGCRCSTPARRKPSRRSSSCSTNCKKLDQELR